MNIQEYIESGIIELYVMNALSESEAAEVRTLAQQHPEVQAEIDEVESVMQLYAQAHSLTPRPDLKNEILDEMRTPKESYNKVNTEPALPTTPQAVVSPKAASGFSGISLLMAWLVVAVMSASAFYFYKKYESVEKEARECAEAHQISQQKNKNAIAALQEKLDILKNPETKEVILNGLPISPKSKVTVFWNVDRSATLLAIQDLPEPPANMQYQLWAIVDKKPVSAGVLDYSLTDIQQMKAFETAEAFAITLEPAGGSENPTLDKMYVMGTL